MRRAATRERCVGVASHRVLRSTWQVIACVLGLSLFTAVASAGEIACKQCAVGRYGQFGGEVNSSCTDACPEAVRTSCTAGTASPRAPMLGCYLADLTTKVLPSSQLVT